MGNRRGIFHEIRYALSKKYRLQCDFEEADFERRRLQAENKKLRTSLMEEQLKRYRADSKLIKNADDSQLEATKEEQKDDELIRFLKERIISERTKLDKTLDGLGMKKQSPLEKRMEAVKKYQAKILGFLYAFSLYDEQANPLVTSELHRQIQEAIISLDCEGKEECFMNALKEVRYIQEEPGEAAMQQWFITCVKENPFFTGGKMALPSEYHWRIRTNFGGTYKDGTFITKVENHLSAVQEMAGYGIFEDSSR